MLLIPLLELETYVGILDSGVAAYIGNSGGYPIRIAFVSLLLILSAKSVEFVIIKSKA